MRKMPISLNYHCTVLCNCHFVHIVQIFIFLPPGVQSPSVFLFFLTPAFSLQGLTFSKTDHTSLFRSWFSTFSVFFKPFLILSSVLWRLAGVPHFPNFDLLTLKGCLRLELVCSYSCCSYCCCSNWCKALLATLGRISCWPLGPVPPTLLWRTVTGTIYRRSLFPLSLIFNQLRLKMPPLRREAAQKNLVLALSASWNPLVHWPSRSEMPNIENASR